MGDTDLAGTFDVLVVGTGIAGLEAALAAAASGARVCVASAGGPFSGSSAFPGTWGLGLVGPGDDAEDFVRTILDVGRGVASESLVRTLVSGVGSAVRELEARGVELRRAERPAERDFVPCFDHRHRSWHGIIRASYRRATLAALEGAGVRILERHELLELLRRDRRVVGASVFDHAEGLVRQVRAGAVVLATGGFGGLFSRTLTMPEVLGTAAALALRAGARLVNVEFVQIMPGLTSPVRDVVFNEKAFRFARVEGVRGPGARQLLDARSGHGPFSSSLADRAVDLAVSAAGERGAEVGFALPDAIPEFMAAYFDWFSAAYGTRAEAGVRIAPYAHASNGGILVDEHGGTGVEGLFACGEAAGGMHGADRIGGLASASALVFGRAAGRAAAAWAAGAGAVRDLGGDAGGMRDVRADAAAAAGARGVLRELRRSMAEHALLERSDDGLARLCRILDGLEERLAQPIPGSPVDPTALRASTAVLSARALAAAMRERTESRGAHFRVDHPIEDPAQARPLAVRLDDRGRVAVAPLALPLQAPAAPPSR